MSIGRCNTREIARRLATVPCRGETVTIRGTGVVRFVARRPCQVAGETFVDGDRPEIGQEKKNPQHYSGSNPFIPCPSLHDMCWTPLVNRFTRRDGNRRAREERVYRERRTRRQKCFSEGRGGKNERRGSIYHQDGDECAEGSDIESKGEREEFATEGRGPWLSTADGHVYIGKAHGRCSGYMAWMQRRVLCCLRRKVMSEGLCRR